MKNSVKCTIAVRRIPLEQFRLESDGRKWNKQARDRRALLLELATYANGDGTFGKFSPSIRTLIETGRSRATLYRHLNDLKELRHLDWTREKHYCKREYRISLPAEVEKQVSDSEENRSQIDKNQVSDSQKQVSQLGASSVYNPSKEPSKREETPSIAPALKPATGRQELAGEYFAWLLAAYEGLSFGTKNKRVIWDFIVSSEYDLDTLKLGGGRILDNLDLRDRFSHPDNRLAASLPESCEAARRDAEKAKREAARRAAMARQAELERERMAAEAEAALAKIHQDEAEAKAAFAEF